MKNKLFFTTVIIVFLISCLSSPFNAENARFFSLQNTAEQNTTAGGNEGGGKDVKQNTPEDEPYEITEKEIIREYKLSFAAAGDNLFHDSVIRSSYINGTYDFSPIYAEVKDIIKKADLAFINQETVMAGERFGYSGYPAFNTPRQLAYTLADTGFDILNLANNHAMDMGRDGLYATLDFLDTIKEFTVIGARKEGENARVITKNNIALGFLAYTHSLNGIPLPRDNPNLVSMINRERMALEINELKPLCDFLIVSIHWGAEYLLEPDRDQVSLANFLAQQNVDLVLGHHPHVLQKTETITRADGKKTIVFYSLGNFASNQRDRERLIGALAVINFSKTDTLTARKTSPHDPPEISLLNTELSISNYGILPVITHFDRGITNTKVYPLYSYTSELLENHGHRSQDRALTMDFFYSVLNRLNAVIITENPF